MRYSTEHKHETRERIVRAASRRFRRQGSQGAAIADLMRDLRLTHGGFYRHFDSKDALFAEALALGLQEVSTRLERAAQAAPRGREVAAVIDAYLSHEHCADPANGCPVAALASELARRPGSGGDAFERAMREHVTRIAHYVPGRTPDERHQTAGLLLSGMAGTLSVARAMTDERRRETMLKEARAFYRRAVGM